MVFLYFVLVGASVYVCGFTEGITDQIVEYLLATKSYKVQNWTQETSYTKVPSRKNSNSSFCLTATVLCSSTQYTNSFIIKYRIVMNLINHSTLQKYIKKSIVIFIVFLYCL